MALDKLACERVAKEYSEKYLKEQSSQIIDKLSFYLLNSLQELRREDDYTYNELSLLPSLKQKDVMEMFLEMNSLNIPGITNVLNISMTGALENVVLENVDLINYPETLFSEFYNYYKLNVLPILESDNNKISIKLKNFWNKVTSETKDRGFSLLRHWPITLSAVAIAAPYYGVAISTSLFALFIISISVMALSTFTSSSVVRDQLELLNRISKIILKLSKIVSKASTRYQYRYAITFKNEERCYKIAGLDPDKLGFTTITALRDESIMRDILSGSHVDKIDKLRNCYLENFLDRISIFFDMYFDCLRKTGNWNDVRSLTDDKFIQMFKMHGKLYPMCDEYRNLAVDAIKEYESLIDFIFEKQPNERSKWYLLMNRYILDRRTPQEKIIKDFRDRNNKKMLPGNSKYKKLSTDIE